MTPSMHLGALALSFRDHPDAQAIRFALDSAFSLGHEFGIERAADVVDQCNKEGPYNAIGAAKRYAPSRYDCGLNGYSIPRRPWASRFPHLRRRNSGSIGD